MKTVSTELGGREISIETGKMAKQASGSVVVRYGDTMVLVAATADKKEKEVSFLPLSVNYVEKGYAAGRIPGGFLKREARLSDAETLISRFIDRPIRPLFPSNYRFETQVMATVLSADLDNEPAVAAMLGASAALCLSDLPFAGPIGGVRIAQIDGDFVINPTLEQRAQCQLDFFVAGSKDAILMVEGQAKEVSEKVALDAIWAAHKAIQPIISIQEDLCKDTAKAKRVLVEKNISEEIVKQVEKSCKTKLGKALQEKDKIERYQAIDEVLEGLMEELGGELPAEEKADYRSAFGDLKKMLMRDAIIKKEQRPDGRTPTEIRDISCETTVLPRSHGSALFTRGETQALVAITLGSRSDEQLIDNLQGVSYKDFLFHYNFPSFSVGEASPPRGPGRREIGHGTLAEKGVMALLPAKESFPYTIRIVSEILESNGSSSMASVCGASLAMMDAGVPIPKHAAGIAMGLIKEDKKTVILSDILGDEDHLGDMDFKVVGTREGITALQMDIKIAGLDQEIMETALKQASDGRMHILDQMEKSIQKPRQGLSKFAPRMITYKINPDRIRDIIGPGGKMIKSITEETGVKMDVSDSGLVSIVGSDHEAVNIALERVKALTVEIEVGSIYHGPVKKIMNFGAFVEMVPGTDGLVHISEISEERIESVESVLKEGDKVTVKVIGIDQRGKYKLSMRAVDKA